MDSYSSIVKKGISPGDADESKLYKVLFETGEDRMPPDGGVPTIAVYSVYNYFAHHLEMARVMFDQVGAAPFTSVDVAALPLLRHLAADAAASVK